MDDADKQAAELLPCQQDARFSCVNPKRQFLCERCAYRPAVAAALREREQKLIEQWHALRDERIAALEQELEEREEKARAYVKQEKDYYAGIADEALKKVATLEADRDREEDYKICYKTERDEALASRERLAVELVKLAARVKLLEAERNQAVLACEKWANNAEQMMKAVQTSAARVKLLEDELRKLYGD